MRPVRAPVVAAAGPPDAAGAGPNEGRRRGPAASGAAMIPARAGRAQWQAPGDPADSAVRKDDPHPQAETAFGLFTVKPAPMSVST